jgi:hypothetical protein
MRSAARAVARGTMASVQRGAPAAGHSDVSAAIVAPLRVLPRHRQMSDSPGASSQLALPRTHIGNPQGEDFDARLLEFELACAVESAQPEQAAGDR